MFFTFGRLSNNEGQTIIDKIRSSTLETRIFPELSDDRGDQGSPPPRQLQAGVTLAHRYSIQEVIGIGGMGSVYEAEDSHSGRHVAVKLIAPGITATRGLPRLYPRKSPRLRRDS